jgi:hypothetical protein
VAAVLAEPWLAKPWLVERRAACEFGPNLFRPSDQ